MLRFGIVGMGVRGNLFAVSLLQSAYAKLIAISDLNKERATKAASEYSVKAYADYRDMIDREQLDGIIITTPDPYHRDPVVYAAERKINILCEKPFATTVEDANAMVESVQKNNVLCMVAFENRWNPPCYAIKFRIDSGEIGDVLFYDAKLSNSLLVPTKYLAWGGTSTAGWYLYPHILDLATWFSGQRVESVYAVAVKKVLKSKGLDTYDTIHSIFRLTGDVTVSLLSSWVLPEKMPLRFDFRLDVVGEKGAFFMNTHYQMLHEVTDVYAHVPTLTSPLHGRLVGAPTQMLYSFIDCIRTETQADSNELAGRDNTAAIAAVHRSISENKVVKI